MIIWSRWGILVFACIGLSVGTGFILKAITVGPSDDNTVNGVFVGIGFLFGAVYVWLISTFLLDRVLDKPRQMYIQQPMTQQVVDPQGREITVATGQVRNVPVMNPTTGQPLWQKPVSSLFFVPVRFWPFVLAALGVLILVINLIVLITR